MVVRYGDFSEKIREYLQDDISIMHTKYYNSSVLRKEIIKYFDKMEKYNEHLYRNILGLLVADTYKVLKVENKNDGSGREELEFMESFTPNLLVSYVRVNPDALLSSIYYLGEFDSYDYFTKRTILNDMKDKRRFLYDLSIFSVYDYLYYCQRYEMGTLRAIYDADLDEGIPEEYCLDRIVETIDYLYMYDKENYKEVMIDLLTKYYMIAKKSNIDDNKLDLDHNDILEVLKLLNNDQNLSDVLKVYVNFDGDINSLQLDNNKILKKINEIKEI